MDGSQVVLRNKKYSLTPLGMVGYLMVYFNDPDSGLTFTPDGYMMGLWTAGDPEEANNVME